MTLIFKQKFSLFDSYDIFDENDNTVFSVKSSFSLGRHFEIFDSQGTRVGTLERPAFSFRPKFEMFVNGSLVGTIKKEFTFFKPVFNIDCNGWSIDGNFMEWDYSIKTQGGREIAKISKVFSLMDTYEISVYDDRNALTVIMLVIAIDSEKDDRG